MKLKKPFQVVRVNTKEPIGSRKELLTKLAKAKNRHEQGKILQDALYPNRLKRIDED